MADLFVALLMVGAVFGLGAGAFWLLLRRYERSLRAIKERHERDVQAITAQYEADVAAINEKYGIPRG